MLASAWIASPSKRDNSGSGRWSAWARLLILAVSTNYADSRSICRRESLVSHAFGTKFLVSNSSVSQGIRSGRDQGARLLPNLVRIRRLRRRHLLIQARKNGALRPDFQNLPQQQTQ